MNGGRKITDKLIEEKVGDKSIEWLKLSLGVDSSSAAGDPESQSRPNSSKVFSCNFCMRKFFSSQALGGHQNAHKKERGATRRYHSQGLIGLPVSNSMLSSLGVSPHSLVHKPNPHGSGTEIFNEISSGHGAPFVLDQTMNLVWPRSFCFDPQLTEQPSETHKLDLNLHL